MKYLNHILLTLFFQVLFSTILAQENKLGSSLTKSLLFEEHKETFSRQNRSINQDQIRLLVKGDREAVKIFLEQNGGKYYYSAGDIHSIKILKEKVGSLAENSGILRIESNPEGISAMNDSSKVNNRIHLIEQGLLPDSQQFTGKDVIVGIVDLGLDFDHPDFVNDDGSTRVLAIWDQTENAPTVIPNGFDYGQYWDSTDINSGNCTHDYAGSHGTASTGTAAGNGRAYNKFKGYAPEADIVFVNINTGNGFTSRVTDAVQFIFDFADSVGKPCVINTSIGSYKGAHDGLDLTSQAIDNLLQAKPGRVLVASAGNAGDDSIHVGYEVTADTVFTCMSTFNWGVNLVGYWEAYVDSSDWKDVHFCTGVEKITPVYSRKSMSSWKNVSSNPELIGAGWQSEVMYDENNDSIGTIMMNISLNGAVYECLYYFISNKTYFQDTTNLYPSMITTGSGKCEMWTNYEFSPTEWSKYMTINLSAENYPELNYYKSADNISSLVSYWQCSPYVVTVGNYRSRNTWIDSNGILQTDFDLPRGQISPTSSMGPTRTGTIKPDVASPGEFTFTAGNLHYPITEFRIAEGGKHYSAAGTSIAAPAVAGVLALYLEANPTADINQILLDLRGTTYHDNNTGGNTNNTYGYGKVDGFRLLKRASTLSLTLSTDTSCVGTPTVFNVEASGYSDSSKFYWDWNNDSVIDDSTLTTNISHLYADTGNYTASLTIQNGDTAQISETVAVRVNSSTNSSVDLGEDTMVCNGSSVQLLVFGAYTSVSWNNGDQDNITNYTAPDTAIVSAIDSNNCVLKDTALILAKGIPLQMADTVEICQGDTVQLNFESTGASYLWNDSSTAAIKQSTSNELLWLVRVDSNSCSYRDSSQIVVHSNPIITFSETEFCAGDTLVTSIGHESDSILWSNGSSSSTITLTEPDTLNVTVIDSNNCSAEKTLVSIKNTPPSFDLGNDTMICYQDSMQLVVAGVFNSIVWSTGEMGNQIFASNSDTFSVVGVDRKNCVGYDTIIITKGINNSFSLGADTSLCTDVTLEIAPNRVYDSYVWSNGDTTANTIISTAGNYSLTAIDSLNCQYSDGITISYQDTLAWNISDTVTLCEGAEQTVEIMDYFVSYSWSSGQDSNAISFSDSGEYVITATHENGCVSKDSFFVISGDVDYQLDFLSNVATPAKGIFGNSTPNLGSYTFKWFFGDGDSATAYHPSHNYIANGTYDVMLIAINNLNGCQDTLIKENEITINQIAPCEHEGEINFNSETIKCLGDTFILHTIMDSNYVYQWFKNDLAIENTDTHSISVSQSGSYKVKTIYNDCSLFSEEVSIDFSEAIDTPVILLSDELNGCASIILSTQVDYDNYLWSNNESESTISVKTGGVFSVTVWNDGTCELNSDSVTLGGGEIPDPQLCSIQRTGDSSIVLYYDSSSIDSGISKIYFLRKKLDEAHFKTIGLASTYSGFFFDDDLQTHRVDSFYYVLANKDTCGVRDTSQVLFRASYLDVENQGLSWKVNWNKFQGLEEEQYILNRATIENGDTSEVEIVDTFSDDNTEYIEVKTAGMDYIYQVHIIDSIQCDSSFSYSTNTFITKMGTVVSNTEKSSKGQIVYPNPVSGYLNIQLDDDKTYIAELLNVLGSSILNSTIIQGRDKIHQIQMGDLEKGIYFLRLQNLSNGHLETIKVQKR